ncbi:MAG: SulP family inorganic anion transporter [Rhodobiaceae bacterium]|nr:SulP family inorganic anion transporter [Rhodobiaceae bacterium]MCC0015554.1 SulP family inorganic anion transporter [Rhodobiaceae bacterium]MCC0040880.1 SulP family inorganic anion transporter [Rhodobiaceae bacterium]MCC0053207.1 SulP family inorganic anion transporter [Rhodobiaceae bacterium]
MDQPATPSQAGQEPGFRDLFTPKLVTVLREGYGAASLRADAIAGLTVAIVALPLSMAIAIASGVSPERGLYTAIVGGFLVSALGGSRFQIGGPAGAFIVLVAASVQRHGYDGLVLAILLSGVFLMAVGFFKLGTYIKFIPYPVTVGFTAGIAVIIFSSQIHELLGLKLTGPEPGELIPKLQALARAAPTLNPAALAIAVLTIAIIVLTKRLRPGWPGMLFALAISALVAAILDLPVETIGTRFGALPNTLPLPAWPDVSLGKLVAVLPDAIAFTLLGAIESLLSAVVADGMTGRRHRSNCELVAQGAANIGSALFGGVCVTGTIARTATNVRAGAHGPVAGMLHALFLLLFLLVAAPLAGYVPLAALAGILAVVTWGMIEKHAFAILLRSSRGDAIVLLATFLITIFRDLTEGIVVGTMLGAMMFIERMSSALAVAGGGIDARDHADRPASDKEDLDAEANDPNVLIYRISGAFFFGAVSKAGSVLDRIADQRKTVIIDFTNVPFLDSTAANTLKGVHAKAQRAGIAFYVTGAAPPVRRMLKTHGLDAHSVRYRATIAEARAEAHAAMQDGAQ